MTILVTGGCGFIGSNFILKYLQNYNAQLINVDKLSYASNNLINNHLEQNNRYTFIQENILSEEVILSILTKYCVTAVVHFAAESHVDNSIKTPNIFIQNNICGTYSLLNATLRYWSTLSENKKLSFKFINVSTDEVYGTLEINSPPKNEDSPYLPNNPYAASKASADHIARSYYKTYGLPVTITNCSNNYGPYQNKEKLIPMCIYNALNNKDIPVYGNGLQIRDWIYVEDHCNAIIKILTSDKVCHKYNIGSSNEKTNLEVIISICSILDKKAARADGKPYANQMKHVKDRLGHDFRYAIDSSKIQQELAWRPLESFTTGLEKTVDWYLCSIYNLDYLYR